MPFSSKTFAFLADLAENNDRDWFNANKARYESDVREPGLAFVRAMAEKMPDLSPHLLAVDKKVGGSMMRIHRDVRFSKDKSPYKTNVGIQFRHASGKDVHAPGLYVHVQPDECFLGAGIYTPDNPTLGRIRAAIDADPGRWTALLGALPRPWAQEGESLKRAPKGFPKDHPLVEDLKRKSFILVRRVGDKQLCGKGFPDRAAGWFAETTDYVRFVCDALELPF